MAQLLNLLEDRLKNTVFGFEVHNNLLKRDSHIRPIQIKGLKTSTEHGHKLLSIQGLDNRDTGCLNQGIPIP